MVDQFGYHQVHEDLKKLSSSKNDVDITELAAYGIAFATVALLLPEEVITKVVQTGGSGDFFLNGRRTEMIEVSGMLTGSLEGRFTEKRVQILKNPRLLRAFVSVTRFRSPSSRLERVR